MAGSAPPLAPGEPDTLSVGLVQDLLRGHGYSRLPNACGGSYGKFGNLTRRSILAYRETAGLPGEANVDGPLLQDMVRRPALQPVASRGYLALVLDVEWDQMASIVALTCLFESNGRFDCLNLNTDRAGLSFGIIQWAQRPGRLHEVLDAFHQREPELFAAAAVDPAGLLAHTARDHGGVNAATGATVDARFDLVREPWKSRFLDIARRPPLQRVQVDTAMAAFRASLQRVREQAPGIHTQRGLAFMLDLANQHGDGGAHSIYLAAAGAATEPDLLAAMERESVRRVEAQYGAGGPEALATAERRAFFRTTPLLTDAAAAWA